MRHEWKSMCHKREMIRFQVCTDSFGEIMQLFFDLLPGITRRLTNYCPMFYLTSTESKSRHLYMIGGHKAFCFQKANETDYSTFFLTI